jgi:hypothetical protein
VKEHLAIFEKEEDRIQALKQYFGIELSESQKAGITGMVSAI